MGGAGRSEVADLRECQQMYTLQKGRDQTGRQEMFLSVTDANAATEERGVRIPPASQPWLNKTKSRGGKAWLLRSAMTVAMAVAVERERKFLMKYERQNQPRLPQLLIPTSFKCPVQENPTN